MTEKPQTQNLKPVNPENTILATNLDKAYPLYVTLERNILPYRPYREVKGGKREYLPVLGVIYPKEIRRFQCSESEEKEELVQKAKEAAEEFGTDATSCYKIQYEVYRGDYEELIATAEARLVEIEVDTSFNHAEVYTTMKRMLAAHTWLQKYTRTVSYPGIRPTQSRLELIIRIPLPSPELRKALEELLGVTNDEREARIAQLKREIAELEKMLDEKRRELSELLSA